MKNNIELSIITPFYNENDGVNYYFDNIIPILNNLNIDYEIICIDDGSVDDTYDRLKEVSKSNSNIKLIKFTRNFGKEVALTAGLDKVLGKYTIPIDSDLQDPPELIELMLQKAKEGFDIVLMKRKTREEGFLKKISAKFFYFLLQKIGDIDIPNNIGDFRLLSYRVILSLRKFRERNRFMKGIFACTGFKYVVMEYDRPQREKGTTRQNWKRLISLAFDGIFSFSSFPIRIWTYMGLLSILGAFIFAIYIILQKLIVGIDVAGYPSIITVVIFLNGMVLVGIGILGEYISRIFKEVKARPIYIVEESIGFDEQKK